ncbi:MAG TPA: NB-ARC domain-containing protein, partial [Candidatus Obscuribacterales bacterium]
MPRPRALAAVKEKLLADCGQTLVVSAISGLGGLGKSVLATAIALDPQVQGRFSDGVLWVTLGQNPNLASLLGDWVRTLDKSRDSYSVTTLELARDYLHNLLIERRMLLVVDDVWNAAHAEWFRVGGSGCRVLVTTREARLAGAEYHELDLMTEAEAISLVQQKLGEAWREEDEAEFRGFAKSLSYLPLALDLAANQVQDGLTWAELRQEIEEERRAVAVALLDSTEAWEALDQEKQRKYSLRACF